MMLAVAIVGALLWAAMLWFFLGPTVSRRLGHGEEQTLDAPAGTMALGRRPASGYRKGSAVAEPGMVGGIAGSVAARRSSRSSRGSGLRSAA